MVAAGRQTGVRAKLVFLVAVMLAGCSSSPSSDATRAPASPPPSEHEQRLDPLPPFQQLPPSDLKATPSTSPGLWLLYDVESDDETIEVTVATGGCDTFSHMTVEEINKSSLVLRSWNNTWVPTTADGQSGGCTANLIWGRYRVRLPEPLRGRRLDGQCKSGDDSPEARVCAVGRTTLPTGADGN